MAKSNKKKGYISKEERQYENERNRSKASFQAFFPIDGIENGCVVDKSGRYYPVLKVGAKNLELMSKEDKLILKSSLERVYGSMTDIKNYMFIIVPMPYDIKKWMKNINSIIQKTSQERINNQDLQASSRKWEREKANSREPLLNGRLKLLTSEREWVMKEVEAGNLTTKSCYLIVEYDNCTNIRKVREKEFELKDRFEEQGITVNIASNQDIANLLEIIMSPAKPSIRDMSNTSETILYND